MNCGAPNTFLKKFRRLTTLPRPRVSNRANLSRSRSVTVALVALLVVTVGVLAATTFQDQRITHNAPKAKDQFAAERAAAMSGNTLIVGAPGDDLNGVHPNNFGSATVFRRNGSTWSFEAELMAADAAVNDQFGVSVDVDGNTAVVGAFADGNMDWGSAYVYERTGSNWTQVRKLTVNGLLANSRLGWDVTISGDYIAVAAIGAYKVFIFERDAAGAGGWSNLPVAVLPGGGSAYGENIDMSGDILAVGARGVHKVFLYDAGINFAQVGVVTGPGHAAYAYSLAIDGNTLAVGHPGATTGQVTAHGGVYVYQRNQGGANNWGLVQLALPGELAGPGNPTALQMGTAVALSGNILVAGALSNDAYGTDSGTAYVFDRNAPSANAWGQVNKLFASNAGAWRYFGASAAANDPTVFVGAPGYIPQNAGLTGEGYIFNDAREGGGTPPPPPPPPPGGGGAPAAPSNLVPTVVNAGRIDLSWNDNSNNENSFKLQRRSQGGNWSTVVWPTANQTSHADTTVSAGTWCYRIRSHNTNGFSAFVNSTPTCVTAGGPPPPPPPPSGGPAAPTSVTLNVVSGSRIDVGWNDASNETFHKLQRMKQGVTGWATIAWPGQNATAHIDNGVTGAGTWCYRIRSHNASGFSAYTSACTTITVGGGGGGGSSGGNPNAPSNFIAAANFSDRIHLAWTDNSNDEHSFKLQWSIAGSDDWNTIWVFENEQLYTHTGLSNQNYCYRIRAHSDTGQSNYVLPEPQCLVPGSGSPASAAGPAAPQDFSATAVPGRALLDWTDAAADELGFKLQWQRPGDAGWNTIWIFADEESFTHFVPSAGTYCYRIRSYDASLENSNYILSEPQCLSVSN